MDLRNRQTEGQMAQTQDRQPGIESAMDPRPVYENENHIGTDKLKGKVALITGMTAESEELSQSLMRKKEQTLRSCT